MAPEYMRHGHISVKIDVFSFGVLVLEIISGQRNNSSRNGGNVQDLLSFVSTRGLYLLLINRAYSYQENSIPPK